MFNRIHHFRAPKPGYVTRLRYSWNVTERNIDEIRDDLRRVREELDRIPDLLNERARLVGEAREQLTWRETADLLGMTETGLRKHQRAYEKRHSSERLAS